MGGSVRVEHINPFISATVRTFQTMVYSQALPGKVALAEDGSIRSDISGVISLTGMARGSVALSFPRITALKVVSAFIGDRILALDDTAADAIGELVNIVAGAAKTELSQFRIQVSLPSVLLGEAQGQAKLKGIVPMLVPFQCPQGNFNLVVRFQSES
jgi:chemotaxis protein CheX